ncbi:MAG: hypothetical protein NW200_08965 [Hyphomonadaceae bacterium]|nr:hypothetical protein [Hyphomonadaceae bacterium]
MTTRPHIDAERWRAVALSWRVWLCAVLVWLAELLGDCALTRRYKAQLRRDLSRAERGLRHIVVLLALARMDWSEIPGRPRTVRPAAVARDRASDLRSTGRSLKFGARSLTARIARLNAVIDDLDAHVARMAARLDAAPRQLAPVMVDDVAYAMTTWALADRARADSS